MLNSIIQGILLGGYYALIASGLSFMFSVMRIINLAHGSLAVVAAYALWVLADRFGIHPFLGLLIVLPAMGLIGWALQRFVLERSIRSGALLPILTTFGLAIVIDNLLFEQFGADTRSLAPYIGSLSYDAFELPGSFYVGQLAVLTFAVAVVMLGGLQAMLSFTPLGRAIRAIAKERQGAKLVGIDVEHVFAMSFGIGLACLGAAACFLLPAYYVNPLVGNGFVLIAFTIVVLGGMGSFAGALAGGLIIGVVESVGGLWLGESLGQIGIFLIFIVVLLFRPQGLFGARV